MIIAKMETAEGMRNFDEILELVDGIMVARGDLGAEIPFSQVPRMQRKIIRLCSGHRTPVIVATHMLESMIENPMPTRAEATDISEAVWQQSDCVMLSGETAGGKFPIKSAEVMKEIILETENEMIGRSIRPREIKNDRDGLVLASALAFQHDKRIKAIFVITRSGYMAHLISSLRPNVPIFAFTNETHVRRKLKIIWGINPFKINFSSNPQKTTDIAKKAGIEVNDGIIINDKCQTSIADIYAAGDVAEGKDFITGEMLIQGNWMTAVEQGEIAAKNMLGIDVEYEGSIKNNITEIFGIDVAVVGYYYDDVVLEYGMTIWGIAWIYNGFLMFVLALSMLLSLLKALVVKAFISPEVQVGQAATRTAQMMRKGGI
jgi:hypothetical protein